MRTSDKIFYLVVATVCSALAYLVLRDIWREPDYTVTRKMIEKAEMEAIFGPEYEFLDDEDEDEV